MQRKKRRMGLLTSGPASGLAVVILLIALPLARADSRVEEPSDHYAGLQLAPSVHAGVVHENIFVGAAAELSFQKWLLIELAVSGQTPPMNDSSGDDPGAVHTSLGVYSRAGGATHAFVYGVGMSYSNRYECPDYCSVFSAIYGPEEDRAALNLVSADFAAGYEMRLSSGFFLRGMTRLEAPVYLSDLVTRDYGDGETSLGPDRNGKAFLLRLSVHLTVGYALKLHP